MDDPELVWRADEVSLGSFMSTYAPMPEHLRRRRRAKRAAGLSKNLGNVVEQEQGNVVADDDEGVESEDETALESDPEDDIPLIKRKVAGVEDPLAVPQRRTRRRLIKRSQGVGSSDMLDTDFETNVLEVPVSI